MSELLEAFGYTFYTNRFDEKWIILHPFFKYHRRLTPDNYGDTVL